jgi:hypothetical protein
MGSGSRLISKINLRDWAKIDIEIYTKIVE